MSDKVQYHGISFVGLLTIVFIVLKLCNVIAWSWWWVLSPIIISFGIWFLIAVVVVATLILSALINER